ncbi:MAG: hypothetical protein ACK4MT_08205 [Thermaurantiacus tibetensis]
MATLVTFVAAVGRMSMSADVTRPVIEQIAGKHRGTVRPGGVGSANDPIVAEFAEKGDAVEAAKEAWFHDSVESATVHDADNLATSTIKEDVAEGKVDAVEAVQSGLSVSEAVEALLAAHAAGKLPVEEDVDGKLPGTEFEESAPINESVSEAELPRVAALAERLDAIVAEFADMTNDTAAVFVEDARAAADALKKLLPAPAKA